ncbi:MAG: efflux RND transporter periplasmic adaptor subunit [Planctomycetia bacterium]|nr:efflux RND transporter periplasmic adaptor subunit [Planctomycetia bacterium]
MQPGLTAKTRTWRTIWMAVGVLALVWILVYVARPAIHAAAPARAPAPTTLPPEPVQLVSSGLIRVDPTASFRKQLQTVAVEEERVSFPLMNVSGYVIARVRAGQEPIEDRWQFSAGDLSTAYADWLRVQNEVDFADRQLSKVRELAEAETSFLQLNLDRLKPGLDSGSIPEKDYRQAKADLVKSQLESEKNVFSAESTLRAARRSKTALERHLSQAGIEPIVFTRAVENMVLVVANVPETKVALVREEQPCEARFYGYPDRVFPGHVEALNPLLTEDRRTLRVLFDLNDPEQILRPGMFAEVGLGTEERTALLVPGTALLHVGQSDYVLVQVSDSDWRITQVKVAGSHDGEYEVASGLASGDRVISHGAILLKPMVTQSVSEQL